MLVSGILTVLLGVLALAAPTAATLTIELITGTLFLCVGVSGLWLAWKLRNHPNSLWRFLSSLCFLVPGVWLLAFPLQGAVTLTLLLGVFIVADGLLRMMFVPAKVPSHNWLLIDGIVGVLLGTIVLSGWPGDSVWLLGLLVGMRLIVAGFAILMARKHLEEYIRQIRP